jgi:diacylglycerol kinase family enzyme
VARSGLDFDCTGRVNVWILCNEDAGRGLSAEDLRELVERAGHTVIGVAKQYDEQTRVPRTELDLVVAAGGDGTVATVAAIAAKSSVTLAILPLGTANNIATSLGVNRPVSELIASWSSGRRVPFDLGRARAGSKTWCVVEGVGGGLVPAGIKSAQSAQTMQSDTDPAREVDSAVRTFRHALDRLRARPWTLTIDGTQSSEELLLVEVLNIRAIGPNLVLGPDANPSDGFFDVVTAQECHREQLTTYLDRRAEGRDMRLALPTRRAREVVIGACNELHIDDERIDMCDVGPISISIEPAAATVLL